MSVADQSVMTVGSQVIVSERLDVTGTSSLVITGSTIQKGQLFIVSTSSMTADGVYKWQAISDTSEVWDAISDTAETWTQISDSSETWDAIADTNEIWSTVADNSESWQIAA